METRRYKVRLNSIDKLEELLQEIYDQACKQINEIDNEINKITNSTNLGDDGITIDEKLKYATAVHNFTDDKRKAINAKFEIAKFMGDVIKHNGDIAGALNERTSTKRTALKLDDIRAAIEGGDDSDTYNLKKN